MKIAKLINLAAEARKHPHYQHREMNDNQMLALAGQSFDRLTKDQQAKVWKSWNKALKDNKGADGIAETQNDETVKQLLLFRFLAQTNLFFLCNLLEKYSQVTVNTHEDICNSFFVQKNPTFASFEKFANQYTDLKDRMLLVPRGGFKSSIDIADCVQWIICYPRITILILTGVYDLASDFVGELKQHFSLEESGPEDAKTGKKAQAPRQMLDPDTVEWSDSLFQVIFPEHCIPQGEGNQFEFQTPAGGDDKEPTVRSASIEQALAGSHYAIIKLDDVVTDKNSLTSDQLVKISKQISVKRGMMHPYGFMDVIGTWYDEFDYYGQTISQEEKLAKEEGLEANVKGTIDSGRFESNVFVKIYLRSAWWPTAKAALEGKIEAEFKKDDYELWFPERLTYAVLRKEQKFEKNPGDFAIKYMNNPRQLHKVKFPRELLMRRTIKHDQLPPQGIVVTTIDTAYSVKSWADYTVILTALIFGGRFYIINMVRGRYNEFELPAVIAAAAYKWKPKRIAIEDSMGVKWMGRELKREMDKLQINVPVEFCSLGIGSKKNSKQMKAKPVLRLLGDERMYFLNSCEGLQEIYGELEKFTGRGEDAHDDIVSGLSLLVEVFGGYAEMKSKVDLASTQFAASQQDAIMHDMIYGLNAYAKYNANQADDNPTTAFQLEKGLYAAGVNAVAETDFDPFADLM